jgi:transposase
VSVASVVKWSLRFRSTGSAAAKRMGRNQPRSLAAERDWLLGRRAATPDLTLRALVVELGERRDDELRLVWRIVHDAGIIRKNSVRHRAESARQSQACVTPTRLVFIDERLGGWREGRYALRAMARSGPRHLGFPKAEISRRGSAVVPGAAYQKRPLGAH